MHFAPLTVEEMSHALNDARNDSEVGVVILTGEGKDAFCSGGDQKIRGTAGYADEQGVHRLNVLDFQRQMRSSPKPIIAMVAGLLSEAATCSMCFAISPSRLTMRFLADGPQSRLVRRRLRLFFFSADRRAKESARNLGPLPPIHRRASARNGTCQLRSPYEKLEEKRCNGVRESSSIRRSQSAALKQGSTPTAMAKRDCRS